ncbi:Calcium permeable stress-gated cation channel 1 [Pseudocercospora fuligena]|uniref:Calcium permeable stress-gated cation channel 1 n=1 Tax=Pseudocercospora fuligena TaxID=685502 RepID=A0A8H6RAZ7_9PEZI|nr:Calcium permeable stress-gated cation channel 1 [Pseudocercospora fuligena]
MDDFVTFGKDDDDDHRQPNYGDLVGSSDPRDTTIQIAISVTLGVTAFLAFCVLRPRWAGLYAARKRQKGEATTLPELPSTLFGWIVPLWKITDQQVLASAGLDAYVFLAFFKLAMKFLFTTLLFSLVVIKPVHDAYPDDDDDDDDDDDHKHHKKNGTDPDLAGKIVRIGLKRSVKLVQKGWMEGNGTRPYVPFLPENLETDYLWMYVVFAYLFSAILIYLMISETRRIIEVRQEFLGTQTTVTDRTIRLSGIPKELQDEERIKEFIESLDIGKVERVVLCRNWKELDKATNRRMDILRRLEEAYTIHMGHRRIERNRETLPIAQPSPPEPNGIADSEEASQADNLIGGDGNLIRPYAKARPMATIRYGWLKLQSKRVDAIDYYEEQLRQANEQIRELRAKEFQPTPLAFVTMDSVAACQMAIQAVLDPSPLQLIANQSPEPADVIWENTYLSRRNRVIRNWTITTIIVFLTVFWSAILVPVAGVMNVETIGKVFPGLADVLEDHKNIRSLVKTQLPTLVSSLLIVLVPYLYYWLSWYQGQISRGDIELSAISKNFFFVFFNFFVVLTILGTASKFYAIFTKFGDAIRDFQKVAWTLALSLSKFLGFYVNFIILQGVGLFPFRLLEVGSVSLYPIMLIGAKTPRDYAELVQPPVFSYGFYLPNALLIFIICLVYSVLRNSWQVLLAGFLYFSLGHFCYKYQLLYAMDHRQQTSGRSWVMICDRIFIGMIFFQITTAGQLILKQAFARSVMMVPLTVATIWIMIVYGKTYKPLMKFIALSAVKRGETYQDHETPWDVQSLNSTNLAPETSIWAGTRAGVTADGLIGDELARATSRHNEQGTARERNLPFINPSLVAPLDGVWIAGLKPGQSAVGSNSATGRLIDTEEDEGEQNV